MGARSKHPRHKTDHQDVLDDDLGEDEYDQDIAEIDRLERELLGDDDDEPMPNARRTKGTRKAAPPPPANAAPAEAYPTGGAVRRGATMSALFPSNSNFLMQLALAHQEHEGFKNPTQQPPAGSLAYRNNNPGNLRFIGQPGATQGQGGFAAFPTYQDGLKALMYDLWAKLTGHSRSSGTIHSLQDYVRVYAPADDGNDPNGYTQALVRSLNQAGYPVTATTSLQTLASYI